MNKKIENLNKFSIKQDKAKESQDNSAEFIFHKIRADYLLN